MCDTLVALPNVTTTGTVILGKNSDRPAFDCQPLHYAPRTNHPPGEVIPLAYVELPQVETTYATVGSRPYWCWGYEEGFNEFGVAIGNEAIFTRESALAGARFKEGRPPELGLLGMELVRLALERGQSAAAALEVITGLVEKHGQWGSGVPGTDHLQGSYNNSFIIADPQEAWVLETAGKRWVARRVTQGYAAISNEPSIRTVWQKSSPDLVSRAVEKGWWPAGKEALFDFALAYTDRQKPLQVSHIRAQRLRQLLAEGSTPGISPQWVKRILRDHYEDTFLAGPYFNAALPDFLTICMHSSPAGFTWGNTASSAVFILPVPGQGLPHMWWCAGTPCTGVYLPVFLPLASLPEAATRTGTVTTLAAPPDAPRDTYSAASYWWKFRHLLDVLKGDEEGSLFSLRQRVARLAFDRLEAEWEPKARAVEKEALAALAAGQEADAAELLAAFTAGCTEEALATARKVKEAVLALG
ncbi:MAG TPA: secernin-2 [Firmicutes bacterium]|nr:secernin-2 [Bacillota bacterium]